MAEFLRSSDAFTWAMESDPRLRSTVVTLILLDKPPDWDVVRERFDHIASTLPMLRQRVVESPPPAPPRWESAPDFDVDFHIRRIAAPGAGTLDGLLELARIAEMEDFDRARPLWTVTLIDGTENGGSAVLCKFHHALTDGVGGVQIGMTLFDQSAAGRERDASTTPSVEPGVPWLSRYRDVFGYDAGLVATAVTKAVTSTPRLIVNSLLHPLETGESTTATAAAVNVTLLTYVDTCALGVDVDTGAIPDYDVFHECLVAGFDEVLAIAD